MAATQVMPRAITSDIYSTGVPYPLPVSTKEHARLEEQSECLAELMGTTTHSPIVASPSQVLDIGCGTGAVTRYLGRTYPGAKVYGVDLSKVPVTPSTPANVTYIQGNVHYLHELDERLARDGADLVFGRLLVCGITDWPGCIAAMRDLTKPGGWVELQDLNNQLFNGDGERVDTGFEWMTVLRNAMIARGLDPDAGMHTKKRMEEAGLVDVQSKTFKFTMGPWLAESEPRTRRMGEFKGNGDQVILATLLDETLDKAQYDADKRQALKEAMWRDMAPKYPGETGVYYTYTVTIGRRPIE